MKIHKSEICTPIAVYFAVLTDLWGDGEGGWSGNYSWCRKATVIVPWGSSNLAVARKIKAALDIQGMRNDSWAGSRFCWRDGCVGAYAFEQGSN